jgi:thioredoxin reductase
MTMEEHVYDLVIIGGGAAGLAAASYALGKELDTLLIYDVLGGKAAQRLQIRMDEEEEQELLGYPFPEEQPVSTSKMAGEEMIRLFSHQVKSFPGMTIRDHGNKLSRLDSTFYVETTHQGVFHGRSVIVATGVAPRQLDVPGARALLGMGLGYSATTHTRTMTGKRVAVIGTTPRVLQGAIELTRTAQHIFMIIPAGFEVRSPLLEMLRKHDNVEVLADAQVQSVEGASVIERVVLYHQGSLRSLDVDAAFVGLGLTPNTELVRQLNVLDKHGYIQIDGNNATSLAGLFAAGDVTTHRGEQVLIAIGEGARAATSAYDFLMHQQAG